MIETIGRVEELRSQFNATDLAWKVTALEAENKLMKEALRALNAETKRGLEIMGTMTPRQM